MKKTETPTPWLGLAAVWLIIAIIASMILISTDNNVKNSYFYLQEAETQRQAILDEFDDVLSNEDYIQLMNAAVPEDINFLKNNPQVSDFLLGRADRIVSINARYFEIRNNLLEDSKSICNVVQNPLVPQLPFVGPDCRLGEVIDIVNGEPEQK